MTTDVSQVVIVGGGIVSIATAYFLAKAGFQSTGIEHDAVDSHTSGFAYEGLSPTGDSDSFGNLLPNAQISREFATTLQETTGINTEFDQRPTLSLAFTERMVQATQPDMPQSGSIASWSNRWVDDVNAQANEPRISRNALGDIYNERAADVEPYRFVLVSLATAEKIGNNTSHRGDRSQARWVQVYKCDFKQ